MTTANLMSGHPADETLAAYADGRLDGRGSEELVAHLAACDDCRAVFDAIADAQDEGVIEAAPAPVVRGNFGPRAAITTLAAAAAATAVFFTPPVQEKVTDYRTGGISKLVKASESLKERPLKGRLAGGFPWRKHRVERGDNDEPVPIPIETFPLLIAAGEVQVEDPEARFLRARRLHASGVALLLTGEREEAIAMMEKARARTPDDPVLLSDLAAAYIERARYSQSPKENAVPAVKLAERAWLLVKTPETAWNRALAYETAEDPRARAAWNDYLRLDSTSPWADEVRDKHWKADL